MDSNVLRLIRRYDPANSNGTGSITRRSLDRNRNIWDSASSKGNTPQLSDSSPFSSRRSLTLNYDDDPSRNYLWTPRLQHQQVIPEFEPVPTPPPPPVSTVRPILKYTSRSRSEFIVQPHQTEPLTIEIDPLIRPLSNESPATYQPLITTGNKRVCSALSKSEWDLRLQQEQQQPPVRPPSPSSVTINLPQEKESYRPTLGRSKSSGTIDQNKDHDDSVEEFSAPILPPHHTYVDKLKQLFVSKSMHDLHPSRHESTDFHHSPIIQTTRSITKPNPIIQDVTPNLRKPFFRSETIIDKYVFLNCDTE